MEQTPQAYNDNNIDFYRKIKIDTFKEIATLIGLDTGADIDLIYPYIKDAKNLVELGAGYGRAIQLLLQKGFQGKITAIERVPELIKHLEQNISNIVIFQQQDLKKLQLTTKPEAILWLWSGILELSKEEQVGAIQNLQKTLSEKGILVVEIPRKVKYVGVHVGDQRMKVETDWGTIDAYLPRHEEMVEYGQLAGFSEVQLIEYQTRTNLDRSLYLFKK
jgi:SAM-dependent methyltransferase